MATGATKPLRLNSIRLVLIVVMALTTGVFWSINHRNISQRVLHDNASAMPSSTVTLPKNSIPSQAQLTELQVYNNQKYGFSYSYPTTWQPGLEVTVVLNSHSATQQEFGTSLKTKSDIKSAETVEFEVLNESIESAEKWYDAYYNQTPIKVQKSTVILSGKQAIEYDFVSPSYESKQYLIPVGEKTYVLSSVNESMNQQDDPNYWAEFSDVLNSLTVRD